MNAPIIYSLERNVAPGEVEALFDAANFPGREGRFGSAEIAQMLNAADVLISAREQVRLIGIALSLTNFVSVCYLAAFAVHPKHQRRGIGLELVRRSHLAAGGERLSLVSISTPDAADFYERIGMERCRNGFIIPRKRGGGDLST